MAALESKLPALLYLNEILMKRLLSFALCRNLVLVSIKEEVFFIFLFASVSCLAMLVNL